jgi:antiviral helicase SKI2
MFLESEEHREFVTEAIMQLNTTQQFLAPGRLLVVKSKCVCIQTIVLHFMRASVLLIPFNVFLVIY